MERSEKSEGVAGGPVAGALTPALQDCPSQEVKARLQAESGQFIAAKVQVQGGA